jgi:hypothetical protein
VAVDILNCWDDLDGIAEGVLRRRLRRRVSAARGWLH